MKTKTRFTIAMLCLTVVSLRAATFTVTSNADSGAGTLRDALAVAVDGDTIDARGLSGKILLTTGELVVTNGVIILGPGPANLAVDGNGVSRAFHVNSDALVTIAGLTITNGYGEESGGILNGPGPGITMLRIENCNLIANLGGGIANSGYLGSPGLIISNCFFSANYGGGIANNGSEGTVEITDSIVTGNSSDTSFGGGINNQGTLTMTNSVVSSNSVVDYFGVEFSGGGGLRNDGVATVVNTTFSGNVAQSQAITGDIMDVAGGGINNMGTMDIIDCTIRDNMVIGFYLYVNENAVYIVVASGGGVFNGGTMRITGTTLSGNSTTDGPSGIYTSDYLYAFYYLDSPGASLAIINSTIDGSNVDNVASTIGTSSLSILNCTLSYAGLGNVLGELQIGSTILYAPTPYHTYNIYGQFISLGYNLCSDGGGSLLTNATDILNTDPLLGPLQDNGGPTFTHALLPGSPAIDRGFNFSDSANDQREMGFARIADDPSIPNATGGDGSDIGAYEAPAASPPPDSDTDSDGVPDSLDGCPNTPAGSIIDAQGCSIDQLVPCDGPASGGTWKNHGQYVHAVVQTADAFLKARIITRQQWKQIVTNAAQSRCGWNHRFDHDGDRNWHRDWDCDRDRSWGNPR